MEPKEFRKFLRAHPTPAEKLLWDELRSSKSGFKFTRQTPIGRYVVDFCCRQYRLVVELDGAAHDQKPEEDEARDEFLKEQGYSVLRIRNEVVLKGSAEAVRLIVQKLEGLPRYRY